MVRIQTGKEVPRPLRLLGFPRRLAEAVVPGGNPPVLRAGNAWGLSPGNESSRLAACGEKFPKILART